MFPFVSLFCLFLLGVLFCYTQTPILLPQYSTACKVTLFPRLRTDICSGSGIYQRWTGNFLPRCLLKAVCFMLRLDSCMPLTSAMARSCGSAPFATLTLFLRLLRWPTHSIGITANSLPKRPTTTSSPLTLATERWCGSMRPKMG